MILIQAEEMKKSWHEDEAPHKDADCIEDGKHFEGTVWLQETLPRSGPNQLRAYLIFFEPEARTNWHKHPEFQIRRVHK